MPPAAKFPTRRRFLADVGLVLAPVVLPLAVRAQGVPPPATAPSGFRLLRAQPDTATLRGPAAPLTAVWSYENGVPGPTLRAKRGEELRVRLVNDLPEPTAVHWHGVRLPNAMDGTPPLTQAPVQPGASFDYRFTPPDAGTFWYHAAPAQAARGLAGVLIVEESERVEVGRDLTLILQDAGPGAGPDDQIFVNGSIDLELPAPAAERTRLRLINASARLMRIQIGEAGPDELRAWVMAIDGQPAEPFLARGSRVSLVPGNRADLFVETTLAPGAKVPISVQAGKVPAPLIRLVLEGPPRSAPFADPKPLPANALPQRLDLARAQRIAVPIEATLPTIAPGPLFSVRRGRVVVLAFANRSDVAQVVHLHGHSARLLDRLDDGWKPFWLDTLLVEPRQTDRIAFLADNPGKWAIDTRALDRDTTGIAGWFEVT
jgi:FtsP/CotA-like multicopper oxidase with cupredoxin domain